MTLLLVRSHPPRAVVGKRFWRGVVNGLALTVLFVGAFVGAYWWLR